MMTDGPDALSVALRTVSFVLLLSAAGIPIFIAAFGRLMPATVPAVTKLGWRLAMGALIFVAAHHALEAARMTGEMSGVMDPAMQKMALLSPVGAAFAMRMLGLVLVAGGLRRAAQSPQYATPTFAAPFRPSATLCLALLGTLLSTTSFTLVGHTSTTPHRLAAAVLITLHLLVIAFWLGSLWPLYLAAGREQPSVTARVIDAFSMAAAWVVPLILLAGIGLTALLLPSLATFRQPYGQLLLAKVTGFAVLMAMASLNKWHFGPACAEGDTVAFKRTVVIEYVLICIVLAATAVMTTFFSPEVA
ncbi:MAG: copper resistance protein [Gammaproteobacteria bacterium]|jgi:putative copper export protein|nr:copper resistance protein [Gammaproteobacteria bacterium]